MAANFRIKTARVNDVLRIILKGDFDGSSAWELLNNIADDRGSIRRIFINTNGLKEVHPFGKAIFEKQISSVKKSYTALVFIGKHAKTIASLYNEDL
jgi:hypothetical protein